MPTDQFFDSGAAVFNVLANGFNVGDLASPAAPPPGPVAVVNPADAALDTLLNTTMQPAGGTAWFPPGQYDLSADLTTPPNVTLAFANGAYLKPASGTTLQIDGPVDAPLSMIFDVSAGGAVLFGYGVTDHIHPQWFGAKGDAIWRIASAGVGASMTAGDATLTAGLAAFTDADAGKLVTVVGAGANGADLYSTIQSFTSPTQVTLSDQAATTVSDQAFVAGSDDAPAIKAAIAAAFGNPETGSHHSIFFPAGGYLVDADNVIGASTPAFRYGPLFQGEGMQSSQLILRTGGNVRWFYDEDDHLAYVTFENLGFRADSLAFGNGFRLQSTHGHTQMFQFRSYTLQNLNEGYRFFGPLQGSEMRYFGCKFYGITNFYTIEDTQSVNHEFFGCDVEMSTGDLFRVVATTPPSSGLPGGGGSVRMFGGSVIWGENSQADAYLLNVPANDNVGPGNFDFTFTGIRTEMRSQFAKLVRCDGDPGGLMATFTACNFTSNVTGGPRTAVILGSDKSVRFSGCSIPQCWNYDVGGTNPGRATGGIVGFEGCKVPSDLSGKISADNTFGRAYARSCVLLQDLVDTPAAPGGSPDPQAREAVDFDLNWLNETRGDVPPVLKVAVLKPVFTDWPSTGSDDPQILLPANAVVRSIQIWKSGSVSGYDCVVQNLSGVKLAASPWSTAAWAGSVDADLFSSSRGGYLTGTSLDTRTLQLVGTGVPPAGQGVVIIEYY